MSPTQPVAVDPLVGDLTSVRIHSTKDGWSAADGRIVAPGLAITRNVAGDLPARFNLTHLGTGLSAVHRRCGQHILDAAELSAQAGIDWTVAGKEEITAAVKASTFVADLRERIGWLCDDHCIGDGPKPPPLWQVSCSTCGWISEDDDNVFTPADAKDVASDHQCEPEMSIRNPETGKWHASWLVNDDGTVPDLSTRRSGAVTR